MLHTFGAVHEYLCLTYDNTSMVTGVHVLALDWRLCRKCSRGSRSLEEYVRVETTLQTIHFRARVRWSFYFFFRIVPRYSVLQISNEGCPYLHGENAYSRIILVGRTLSTAPLGDARKDQACQ